MRGSLQALVLLTAGCLDAGGSAQPAPRRPPRTVRVPQEGNSWIGSVIPRLHRAGLRIAIAKPWRTSSFDGLSALIRRPRAGTRVPAGSDVSLDMAALIGSPWQKTGAHRIPRVVGTTLREAARHISAAGLSWTLEAAPLPPTSTADVLASYCVTAESPAGGATIVLPRRSGTWQVGLTAAACPRAPARRPR
jgi:hypothetical protein